MCTKFTSETPYEAKNVYHESKGNTKIGKILNTNLIAGDDYINGRTTEKGSCTGCCESCSHDCYARAAYRYDDVIVANSDNTHYARNDLNGFMDAVENCCNHHPSFKYHRWHSSGEILSPKYFKEMNRVARHTKQKHYVYTKRYSWVNNYTSKNGKSDNLQVLMSPPFSCDTLDKVLRWAKKNNPHKFPMFIYDNHTDEKISKLPHCPAVDIKGHKTGVTCEECGRCPKGLTSAVYAH